MRYFKIQLLLSILLPIGSALFAQHSSSKLFNHNWKFATGNIENSQSTQFDDSAWRILDLPHDWAIEKPFVIDGDGNTGKLNWKGQAWYRKKFDINELINSKSYFLLFDGVMAFPQIYVNGQLAGKWDYGYNSFFIDITEFVKHGTNTIAIHVDTRKHDSRWYPGAGIYRNVHLIETDKLHIDVWGTYITTSMKSDSLATVNIQTTISNKHPKEQSFKLISTIYNNNVEVGEIISSLTVNSGDKVIHNSQLEIVNPKIWDIEEPNLYTVETRIVQKDKTIDKYYSRFGIRTIEFTANDGFHLNGRRVQFKGVNLHHDHGPLGAEFNYRAAQRQLEIMKDMGCNAIRTSHNTAAPELIDLCDEMGILFFNEVFDKYDGKADIVDTTDLESFAHRNVRNHVIRDRNHPSIFIWSVGNEIGDVQWDIDGGFDKLKTTLKYVEMYDTTRFTTLVCDSKESAEKRHFDFYDIHSWNYGRRYSMARELEPSKAVIISESASTLSTRGFYEFPLPEKKTDFTKSLQVSSYDLNAPWWAEVADDDFMWQQQEPYVAGEFVWTGFDYLGEPTPYNNKWVMEHGMSDTAASRSSYFGIVDIVGIPKDRYYLYKSYWMPEDTTIHILPHWNWSDKIGDTIPVFIYTNGDSAELFINNESQGVRKKLLNSKNSIERFRLMWNETIYTPGEVKAMVWKDGSLLGSNKIETTGKSRSIILSPDRTLIDSDGNDLSYILIETVDSEGRTVPTAQNNIKINVKGKGVLAGVGNGNPQSFTPFYSSNINLFNGKAMIIVRSLETPGDIVIEVESEGLESKSVIIKSE